MIDLRDILGSRENIHLEAKSAKGGFPDSFWESYSAFANTDGGIILFGVEEASDHTIYLQNGLLDAEKMKSQFWNLVNNRQKISHNIVTNSMVYVANVENKDVLVVEVPRAERMVRPVYKGQDPRLGTYRRWSDGDHLCSSDEIVAMMRDASSSSLDATPINGMNMSVFCEESINSYRNVFKITNPNHLWNQLDNDMFLRRIKAVAMGEDGEYHPTEAGLLMFGYEYEITNRFPQYFLDYQEERTMIGATRWKDRLVSSSGEWSGNLFDFTFKVLPKLQSDLKIPFVLKGSYRVDDTPMHKLLREAMVNTLSNADYNGRQGVVVSKNRDGFTFSNPGRLRIPMTEAVEGGVSDPRNGTILKFFSLIRFGERAGSGLNGIMHIWSKVYHTNASITEKDGDVDRTVLTLPYNGNEQDVDAMLKLYDDYDEILNDGDDKKGLSVEKSERLDLSVKKYDVWRKITDKIHLSGKMNIKLPITNNVIDKITDVYVYIDQHPHSSTEEISFSIEKKKEIVKKYLQILSKLGLVIPEGGNKNRTYSINRTIWL